jgi:hypothetical protein
MAEFTNVAAQTVAANGNVVFSSTAVKGSNCIQHREGSGIITLRGLTNQCKARFFVDFSGNIAIPTGGTVGAISLAIAISGEPVLSSFCSLQTCRSDSFASAPCSHRKRLAHQSDCNVL